LKKTITESTSQHGVSDMKRLSMINHKPANKRF